MAGMAPKRAAFAIEQTMDARQQTAKLLDELDEALADGVVTPVELTGIMQRALRVHREVEEAQLASEWTENGERLAIASLLQRDSQNAALRDIEIRQRAYEIGLVLAS